MICWNHICEYLFRKFNVVRTSMDIYSHDQDKKKLNLVSNVQNNKMNLVE